MKENLQEYVKKSNQMHEGYARVRLMMEYYIFYETVSEGINPYLDSAKDIAAKLHQVIGKVFSEDQPFEARPIVERAQVEQTLQEIRGQVTERMQVLTAYVDQFVVYEYVLNRLQYRFEEKKDTLDDGAFAQSVINFIFGTDDNVTVNDRIRTVLGQLPMRMTRGHYFDLIRDSISVYQGSDRSSLDGYLYMFRTNAMLYHTKGMGEYFTEFEPVLQELSELEYDTLTKEGYDIYAEKIRINATKLNDISDLYMLIQQLINEVYSVVLAADDLADAPRIPASEQVIMGINRLFVEDPEDSEQQLMKLGECFPAIEGYQEKLYDGINRLDAILEETFEAQAEQIAAEGLTEAFEKLVMQQQLASNSVFMELGQEATEKKVTSEEADAEAEKLIAELKEKFKESGLMIRRAIMANTLEKIPVFFTTPQEVADYISRSLMQCNDEAEKYAAKQLIHDLME